MLSRQPAALQAKSLLHGAAKVLQTSNPASDSDLSRIMDSSMYLPLGDPAYAGHRLIEPNYTENSADSLSFVMDAAEPGANPQYREHDERHVERDPKSFRRRSSELVPRKK